MWVCIINYCSIPIAQFLTTNKFQIRSDKNSSYLFLICKLKSLHDCENHDIMIITVTNTSITKHNSWLHIHTLSVPVWHDR